MVLLVHGGPWGRDQWGSDPFHHHLATRGYAVLSVNYRGSTGFGKKFINLANHEWYGKMQDDLTDAVNWAIDQKIADPARVAIMGGSYGGYATLSGLTKTPEAFACGVDLVGISSIVTWVDSFPPYWKPFMGQIFARVGDPTTEEGKKDLLARSPISHASEIRRPLLIAQGKHDPRVKEAESQQIALAVQKSGVPVTYLVYEDEGHGFARPENWLSFNAAVEVFLSQCLGGPYEPYGKDLSGSSVRVVSGGEHVAGFVDALGGR
jgi:dipeptidyl aminopeptidase/acylaminoacyl peptidase